MGSRSSRRGFFRQLAREAGDRLTRPAEEGTSDTDTTLAGEQLPDNLRQARAVRARAARDRVTIDELVDLAVDLGLGERRADVRELARPSVRLTLSDAGEGAQHSASSLGYAHAWPSDLDGPADADKPACLARIDLAQTAAVLGPRSPLPTQGVMWFIAPPGAALRMQSATEGQQAVMVHVSETPSAVSTASFGDGAPEGSRAVELSAELQLPRAWSAPIQALGLDDVEHEAWEQLRRQLADRQGVELHDRMPGLQALHRLLGYPDERRGDMPVACELLARGHALGDDPPYAHPNAVDVEPEAGRWRLLLQLTVDDEIGWSWGAWCNRLYFWIDERDLAAHDFTRVRGIAQ